MGYWYTKLAFNLHRKITSNSFRNPIPRTNHPLFHTFSSPKCYVTHPRYSAIQIQSEKNRHDRRLSSPFVSGGVTRRYYCVTHSPEPGYLRSVLNLNPTHTICVLALTWACSSGLLYAFVDIAYQKTVTVMILIGSTMFIDVFRRMETVPFTNRTRFIFWSHGYERMLGNIAFQQKILISYDGNTLPATHPQCVRTKLIATNIINGLHRGGKGKKAWIDVAYASDIPKSVIVNISLFEKFILFTSFGNDFMANEDDVLDVKWVQNCREKVKWKKPTTNHLKAFDWEILLVNDCTDFTALSLPGGKILMSKQFVENAKSDDEIAAILGHEIAHAVARHIGEKMTLYPDKAMMESFSRKVELEADYIGLLLMASAGYDPRVAPKVYEKVDEIHGAGGDSHLKDIECRFAGPSGEERARLLAEPKVMEEALFMYHDATS